MPIALESIEIKIPEVEPEQEEIKAIEKGRAEYKRGEYIRLSELKASSRKSVQIEMTPYLSP